jgi:hypothetical protein
MGQRFTPAQQFPVNPGDLVQGLQKLLVSLDPLAGLEDLGLALEQESSHLAFGQTAAQIKEGAMLWSLAAMAVGAATLEEAFQKGGVEEVGGQFEGLEQADFALAQGQGGEAREF